TPPPSLVGCRRSRRIRFLIIGSTCFGSWRRAIKIPLRHHPQILSPVPARRSYAGQQQNQNKVPAVMRRCFVFQQVAEAFIFSRFISQSEKGRPTDLLWHHFFSFRRSYRFLVFGSGVRGYCRRGNLRWRRRRWLSPDSRKAQFSSTHPAISVLREIFVAALFALYEH